MRALLTIAFISLFCFNSFSQAKKAKKEIEKKGLIYSSEWSIGARLNTNGWSIFGEKAKILNIYKTRVIQFEFSQLMHYKARKQSAQASIDNSLKDFYYGKQNDFFTIKVAAGFRKMIAGKAEKNGVQLSMIYAGGISLGFLKPYYLNLHYTNSDGGNPEDLNQRYSEENAEKFLDWYSINGGSGFKYGFREIEPVPGAYGKFGLNFDWASKYQFVKALEAGVTADVYYKKLPLMVNQKHRFYLIAAYISFQFGKRKV